MLAKKDILKLNDEISGNLQILLNLYCFCLLILDKRFVTIKNITKTIKCNYNDDKVSRHALFFMSREKWLCLIRKVEICLIPNLPYDDFFKIVDNLYDEIWVYDNNYRIVYVNQATKRHYALEPKDIIGKSFFEFVDSKLWEPSVLPIVYKSKKIHAIRQFSNVGVTLINIATPIFNENGDIQYVAMSVRDELYENALIQTENEDGENEDLSSSDFICVSDAMKNIMRIAKKISIIDSTCLITGESGTGKTMLARYIHNCSDRKDKPFVSINCSSIPHELIESELFGYKKGAFTGANTAGKIGLLEAADGGTVLLDEVGELPYSVQAKLLCVLQDKELLPIGSNIPIHVDIKIIAATNRDLEKLCAAGTFREDLFYRLNVFEIHMPPLRERKEDIEPLIFYYLNNYSEKYGITHEISKETLEILKAHIWRGNIRELSHIIERLMVITDGIQIEPSDLPSSMFTYQYHDELSQIKTSSSFDEAIEEYESGLIKQAYKKYKTTRGIAKRLSISQTRATKLVKKYIQGEDL